MILSVVITWIGGFFLFYGRQAFVKAWFPLVFIVLMVPIPSMILNNIIFILQKLSMETANVLFMISGVPFYNEGFTFHFSDLSVEVAEQCSGIRSSLALFIGSILAGHLFLKTAWRKIVLALVVFPICIMRNGVRIVILSLLGNYVNPGILSSNLHRKGGIPLFIISFAFLMIICWLMRRSENKRFLPGDQIYSQSSVE
jgi:exosortase